MTLSARQDLVRLAREYDALIICDDVYDFLYWSVDNKTQSNTELHKAVIPRLVDVDATLDGGAERHGTDGFGNVMSNGSFSKIVGPGVRTGWAEGLCFAACSIPCYHLSC
jgi:DNA-binding transcriptional MocR family regulator